MNTQLEFTKENDPIIKYNNLPKDTPPELLEVTVQNLALAVLLGTFVSFLGPCPFTPTLSIALVSVVSYSIIESYIQDSQEHPNTIKIASTIHFALTSSAIIIAGLAFGILAAKTALIVTVGAILCVAFFALETLGAHIRRGPWTRSTDHNRSDFSLGLTLIFRNFFTVTSVN